MTHVIALFMAFSHFSGKGKGNIAYDQIKVCGMQAHVIFRKLSVTGRHPGQRNNTLTMAPGGCTPFSAGDGAPLAPVEASD